jgi:ATP-binding cassette subfamily G (WHITE) protein 2
VSSLQDRVALMFFILVLQIFSAFLFMNKFQEERNIFVHERAAGSMTTTPYFFAKMLTELPSFLIFPSLLASIIYFMVNLRRTAANFFIFMTALCVHAFTSSSLMTALGSVAPTPDVGLILAPVVNLIFLVFSGFLINLNNIPVWYSWLQYVSYFRYSLEILLYNEFHNNSYICTNSSSISLSKCINNNGTYVFLGDWQLALLGIPFLFFLFVFFRFLVFFLTVK